MVSQSHCFDSLQLILHIEGTLCILCLRLVRGQDRQPLQICCNHSMGCASACKICCRMLCMGSDLAKAAKPQFCSISPLRQNGMVLSGDDLEVQTCAFTGASAEFQDLVDCLLEKNPAVRIAWQVRSRPAGCIEYRQGSKLSKSSIKCRNRECCF